MINQKYTDMLRKKDIIFEIFGYASKRRAQVGEENVFDFSLGNPSVPAPDAFTKAVCRILEETDPISLHSYSPAGGIPQVRETIARDLNTRYGSQYEGRHIFMTCGAAAALAHALRAVSSPGDTILTFAPCFSEYEAYVSGAGCQLDILPADTENFQINFEELEKHLTPSVAAVLINSPNNPSGVVCSTAVIRRLAAMLKEKAQAFGHPIYLISDEPYRDILFQGTDSPYIANLYPDTITCYSYSKSLSLPGERIGYAAVNPQAQQADLILDLFVQISRLTGHNGAPALLQRAVAMMGAQTSDLSVYETNCRMLYDALTSFGYECVRPGGTFYMFPKSPVPDSTAFCREAMKHDLMLVPGDGFGVPGYFRIAYCVPTDKVERALPVFRQML